MTLFYYCDAQQDQDFPTKDRISILLEFYRIFAKYFQTMIIFETDILTNKKFHILSRHLIGSQMSCKKFNKTVLSDISSSRPSGNIELR